MTRRVRLLCLLFASSVGALARAAVPEEAPPESRAQVDAALRALAPAFVQKARKLAPGVVGTIEHAIAAYAPGTFHLVEEGALPTRRPGARCPGDMANINDRFCIDRYEASLVQPRGRRHAPGVVAVHSAGERAHARRAERRWGDAAGVRERRAGRAGVRCGSQAPVPAGRMAGGVRWQPGIRLPVRPDPASRGSATTPASRRCSHSTPPS